MNIFYIIVYFSTITICAYFCPTTYTDSLCKQSLQADFRHLIHRTSVENKKVLKFPAVFCPIFPAICQSRGEKVLGGGEGGERCKQELSYCTWSAGPCLPDFAHVGVLCTFSNKSAAVAAGFARSSQLSSSLAGLAVQYDMHGRLYVQPAPHRTKHQLPTPPPTARQGRTPYWVNSLYGLCVDVNIPCGDREAARGRRKYMNEGRKEVGSGRRAQVLTPLLALGGGGGQRG